ncbi:MAG: response regulator transcription factor [Acidobacteria bacterium]|nr:response regulator transcription factor [Acidobacteriota bacterium]
MSIRVVVADDQALVRAGFSVLVNSADDLEVVGEASDGQEAIRLVSQVRPDVIMLDVRMPVMDGLEAARRISASSTRVTRILMLTTFDLDEYVFDALRAGASGFLLKDTPPVELLNAIRVIAAGEALLAPSVTRRLIQEFASRPVAAFDAGASRALEELTEREREVMVAVAQGLSNAEIAATLHMSVATVKTHVSRILSKTGTRDRTQLVVLAYQSGLVAAT